LTALGSQVEVLLPGVLAADAGGARRVEVEVADGARLADVLDTLAGRYPLLGRRIRDETGALRRHVNVYLGSDDVRGLLGTGTPVAAGETVLVLPNVAGG
jgi:molybdopterin synthase sulfur carrier subunit